MERTRSFFYSLLEWVAVFAVACLIMIIVRTFVVEPYYVPTASMEPTIMVGDQLLGQKVTLELGQDVSAGDIVVFRNPTSAGDHDVLVKRVIATAGQTVDIRSGKVYVDGQELDEPYAAGLSYELAQQAPGVSVSFPYTVPDDSVWVMGDNRENSADSRYFGAVPTENLVAVAFVRYWPLDRVGTIS